MTKKIFKYPVAPGEQVVDLPVGGRILSVIEQGDTIQMYCLVDDPAEQYEKVIVLVVGTGWDATSVVMGDFKFVGTVTTGPFVWHVFAKRQ